MDDGQMLKATLDIIGAIGVIISIVYMAYQVRQNTKAVKSSMHQAASAAGSSIAQSVATNSDVARIYRVGSDDLSKLNNDDELVQFSALLVHIFRNFENIYFQNEQDILDTKYWTPWEEIITWYFWKPGVQEWWKTRKDTFHKKFVTFLEKSKKPAPSLRLF
jgi:hypothetical protein